MKAARHTALLLAVLAFGPAMAEPDVGAYLAARTAMQEGDFDAAAGYLRETIAADAANHALIESAIAAEIGRGQALAAAPLAEMMAENGLRSQLSGMVNTVSRAEAAEWQGLLDDFEDGHSVSPLIDQLTQGWALVGTGRMQAALAEFDSLAAEPGMRAFGLYHKALALALAGDFDGAEAILSLPPQEGLVPTRQSLIAHIMILSQMDRAEEAIALLDTLAPGPTEFMLLDLRARLAAGEVLPWTAVTDARQGLAEAYHSVAVALRGEADDATTLFHSRIAQALDPRHVEAALLAAQLLERMEQFDLARAAYATVPADHPAHPVTEMGRAEVLRRQGESGTAIEVLSNLTRSHPDLGPAHARLAEFLRLADRLPEALESYDRALALTPDSDPGRWRLLFSRAITHLGLEDWPGAQADFRATLALAPDQPVVLNYYGYSLVERGGDLEAALAMIERAVALDPENGAIVDSLGWALYRLGQVEEAVGHLERAVALLPTDPVINDHLGDAFWAVGRWREAQFQWSRALSFGPEPQEAQKIRLKLDQGPEVDPDGEAALTGAAGGSGG